ncbi:DUF333 domain-containing protein [Proteus myxofaciens]|nr:DUF333 domain-containing protein [Proteus myxofaciens]
MQKKLKTIGYLLILANFIFVAGCSNQTDQKQISVMQSNKSKNIPTTNLNIPLQEPAKATCVFSGGVPSLTYELQGGQTPVCQFANGKRCNEQALIDGNCISD